MILRNLLGKFFIKRIAHAHGFLDPIRLFYNLSRFAQPSEVAAPTELLRATAVLHARGLINSQAIQHNLDWVWPYWVQCQFDPHDPAFVPRSFSLTHINLTHRNWTAVGLPDLPTTPLVDPRGLLMPFWDSWSVDAWIVSSSGKTLFPSRLKTAKQHIHYENNLCISTELEGDGMKLSTHVQVIRQAGIPVCRMSVQGICEKEFGHLIVALRPFNMEGVSFIHRVDIVDGGFLVNGAHNVQLNEAPQESYLSSYHLGDVHQKILKRKVCDQKQVRCDVGMATAAAVYKIEPLSPRRVCVDIPLEPRRRLFRASFKAASETSDEKQIWHDVLKDSPAIDIPDKKMQALYQTALRTLILHTVDDVYAGPFIYRRFWFRDAAFILHTLASLGLASRAEKMIDRFHRRQTSFGYFCSQEGEWDSNGQVLWLIEWFCRFTGKKPKAAWQRMVHRAGQWIQNKRLRYATDSSHAGLLPAGFSAEHLGPNDFYYWDDFWSIAGLKAASFLMQEYGNTKAAEAYKNEAEDLFNCTARSLKTAANRMGTLAMPASPSRRLDSGSIGSLCAGYPLHIFPANDQRLLETAQYLYSNCFIHGGLFHDMSHSGINVYLTLHIAQVFMRAGDERFFELMQAVEKLASQTGQWPEAIHPQTKGGCMGDGQQVWAAAEWAMMMRNSFVYEEVESRKLILCAGIPAEWLKKPNKMTFGPAPTAFGPVRVTVTSDGQLAHVTCEGQWFKEAPRMEVRFPRQKIVATAPGQLNITMVVGATQ